MPTTTLAATLAVIAALTVSPSIATAAPPAPESRVAHAQPWLDWANSVIESTPVKYTRL